MSTSGAIGFKGLKTAPNSLNSPPGSLQQADNCCILTKDILEPRRGQPPLSKSDNQLDPATFGTDGDVCQQLAEWKANALLVASWVDDPSHAPGYTGGQSIYDALFDANAALFDTALPPDPANNKMKFAELAKNLYYTAASGPRVLASSSGSGMAAGVSRPLDTSGPLNLRNTTALDGNPNAAGSWFTTDNAVAYRSCFIKRDANGNVKLSAPNGRFVVVNPKDLTLAIGTIAIVDAVSSTLATATVAIGHNVKAGDLLTLAPGEAAFPAHTSLAPLTVTGVTATTITWTVPAHADATNGVQQTLSSGTKSVRTATYLSNSSLTGALSILAGDFIQLYRTEDSGSATTDPGDEEMLIYERRITTSDYNGGVVIITDNSPEVFLGQPLYTNANTGEGALQANNKPPLCNDICNFDGRLWGAQTTDRQALTLRLIGTGSPNGFQTGDFIAVGNTLSSATISTNGTITQNVFDTAASLVGEYSQTSGVLDSGRTARGIFDAAASPVGQMAFEDINTGGAKYYAGTSRVSAFQDPLPVLTAVVAASTSRLSNVVYVTTLAAHGLSTGASITLAYVPALNDNANFPAGIKTITAIGASTLSYAETGSNGVMGGTAVAKIYANTYGSDPYAKQLRFTKQGQPEAWPQANWLGGLPDGAEVLRILPLQNSLYVFMRHWPIFTVSGSYPYNVQRFDNTASLIAADSLVEHSGRLFGLTTQGVCAISQTGVQVLSLDIEDDLRELIASVGLALQRCCFGVSYESDRQYQLWVPLDSSDYAAMACFVYQSDKAQWTRWFGEQTETSPGDVFNTTARYCGLVYSPSNLAFYGDAVRKTDSQSNTNILLVENKTYTREDFSDYTVAIAGVLHNEAGVLYLTPTTPTDIANIKGGDIALIGSSVFTITGTDPVFPGDIEIGPYPSVPGGASPFTFFRVIPETFEWVIDAGGAAGVEKHWREIQLHFKVLLTNYGQLPGSYAPGYPQPPAANGIIVASFSNEQSGASTSTVAVTPPIAAVYPAIVETGPYVTVRIEVPDDMQRAAMLRVNISIASMVAEWQLLGWSKTQEAVSERTGQ